MWQLLVYLVLFFVLVAIIVIVFFVVRKRKKVRVGEKDGAAKAVNAARRWALSNGFKVIAPAHLAGKGSFAALDAIVIGYFGVLGVRAYGYNGEVYGTAADEEWLQVGPDATRNYFKNPINEANADVRVIRDALFNQKIKMTSVEVVCVFTDKKAQLAIPKSTGHFTMKTFKDYLDKEKFREDKGVDLDKVEAAIRGAMVTEQ